MYETILAVAEAMACKVTKQADMRRYTSFRVGGPADLLIEPNSTESLSALLKACKQEGIKPIVLGRGTNVLIPDSGLHNVVLLLGDAFGKIAYCGNNMVRAQAGASVSKLCRFALDYALTGMEFAYGIPGSVGGAVYMNAGAYGGEMKDVVMVVNHMTLDGEKGSWQGTKELGFSYRHSRYMETDFIITSVIFYLDKGNPDAIKLKMDQIFNRRVEKQPLEYPSAGSTFKRPEGHFAGALIEECNLKGYRIGGAEVSQKHAGFVINAGQATAGDIQRLISHIQKTVLEKTGVQLEPEVRIF